MKSFFCTLITLTLGLALFGVSAHAQTTSTDILLAPSGARPNTGTEYDVTVNKSGNAFTVTVQLIGSVYSFAGPHGTTDEVANQVTIELFDGTGGGQGGSNKLDFTGTPTGNVNGTSWSDAGSTSTQVLLSTHDEQTDNGIVIGENSFTGNVNLASGQNTAKSFQVNLEDTDLIAGAFASQGGFGNFTPDGASLALIVPGLLPLGVALRRRRSKAQA
jgi:hypothetical protein